jgi:hypothetical protein
MARFKATVSFVVLGFFVEVLIPLLSQDETGQLIQETPIPDRHTPLLAENEHLLEAGESEL